MENLSEFIALYNDQISPDVPGWFYLPDQALFYLLMRGQTGSALNGNVCEVGVYVGKSAIAISRLRTTGEIFYGYDTFDAEPGQLEKARANLERFSNHGEIKLVVKDSQTLAPADLPTDLRFVHIDGDHRHSYVLKDLHTFLPRIREFGVIVLDDILDNEFPGVASAMAEFCLSSAGSTWRPFVMGQNKAYLCRRKYVGQYQTMILNAGVFMSCSTTQVLDGEVLLCNSREPKTREQLNKALGIR